MHIGHLDSDGSQIEAVRVVLLEADLSARSHLHISSDLHNLAWCLRDCVAFWGMVSATLIST